MAESKQGSSGAKGGARDSLTRRLTTLGVMILFAFGLAVPTIVLFSNGNDKASAGPDGMHLNREEVAGRELFSKSCFYCHTLAATNSVGRTGPDLDILLKSSSKKERQALVEGAIEAGEANGRGQMPALLYRGKEAKEVAKFVAAVAGVGIKAKSVEPAGYPEIESKAESEAAIKAEEAKTPKATPAQLAVGKKIVTTTCGACHTLAADGTKGTVGPNLDSLKPSYETVEHQVINGGGPMPAFGKEHILTQAEVEDVSHYVSTVAGTK